ncbi:hypothetical protein KUTeg_007990 [Tegillarca granosa]|uniref:Uncharacterized protein n=1 Tax=Tegillarca granosa TaxID=220873 RepID=A0ABQ9FJH7_TEGGR|nr:hypothetical protein KUTeg_007990 [Tegillarca granosa]
MDIPHQDKEEEGKEEEVSLAGQDSAILVVLLIICVYHKNHNGQSFKNGTTGEALIYGAEIRRQHQ